MKTPALTEIGQGGRRCSGGGEGGELEEKDEAEEVVGAEKEEVMNRRG